MRKFFSLPELLPPEQRRQLGMVLLLSLVASLLGVMSVFLAAPFVSIIANHGTVPTSGWLWRFFRMIDFLQPEHLAVVLACALTIVFLLKATLQWFANSARSRFMNNNWQVMSTTLFEQFIRADFISHSQRSTSEIITALSNDTRNYFSMLNSVLNIVVHFASTLVLVGVLGFLDWRTAMVVLIIFLLTLTALYLFQRRKIRLYGFRERQASIKALSCGSRVMGAWKEIRVQKKTDAFISRYRILCQEVAKLRQQTQMQNFLAGISLNLVIVFVFALIALLFRTDVDVISYIPQLTLMLLSLLWLFPNTTAINHELNILATCAPSFENLQKILLTTDHQQESDLTLAEPVSFRHRIRLKGIYFSYTTPYSDIFRDAEMLIPARYTVAVTGSSGIGKTTLVDMILGLLKPQSGQILYDETDIASLTTPDLSRIASYIPQLTYLNGDTILDNIVFDGDTRPDICRVWKSLEMAGLKSMIEALPNGLDTLIGENGSAISGGQRQRIAIARALYRDFELLVMDESMSSLDLDTESAILDSIAAVANNKTLLIITHRMKTAEQCDIIYRVEEQQIFLEKGADILARHGGLSCEK